MELPEERVYRVIFSTPGSSVLRMVLYKGRGERKLSRKLATNLTLVSALRASQYPHQETFSRRLVYTGDYVEATEATLF
jgi:hypothetical protein